MNKKKSEGYFSARIFLVPGSVVMCKAVSVFYSETGIKVGFKAAGGIATHDAALMYHEIVNHCLGSGWLNNKLFRIGASRLANNILSEIAGEHHEHF